jgi:hypothetical protein
MYNRVWNMDLLAYTLYCEDSDLASFGMETATNTIKRQEVKYSSSASCETEELMTAEQNIVNEALKLPEGSFFKEARRQLCAYRKILRIANIGLSSVDT